MPGKKVVAVFNITKALAGATLTAVAAVGGASGNPWMAGLAAFPAAGLASYDSIAAQITALSSPDQKEVLLELPVPDWWTSDARSWQDVCSEIVAHFPRLLQRMTELMQGLQDAITRESAQQAFIEALTTHYLTWAPDPAERRKIAEVVVSPIFQKLSEVLTPVIEQIQQERAFIDYHQTASNTGKAVAVLEQIRDAEKPPTWSEEELSALRRQYCQALHEQWKTLDFRGIMHADMNRPISIPLSEVFVLPEVLMGVPEYETLEREESYEEQNSLEEDQDLFQEEDQDQFARQDSLRRMRQQTTPQRKDLRTVVANHHRLIILGDPGSGKSTLLRYLLLQLSQENESTGAKFPQLADAAHFVPLYLPLSSYAEVWLTNTPGTRSLEDFLPEFLHENYLGRYSDLIRILLQQGKVFLLLDGLDEIPDVALRMKIVRQVELFTQAYPKNRFIVTSRIVGYREAKLGGEYQAYTLADFNEKQIKAFTQRWCPAYERWVKGTSEDQHLEDLARSEAEKLFEATQRNPGVKRLAVNPLLLTILALIQRQGIELPSHRIELFELCATTLLDTWVKARGQSTHFTKDDLIKILRPLAFWMHEHPAVGAIPERELIEQIVGQFLKRRVARHEEEAMKMAEHFLDTVRGKTGILIERGKRRYGFLHLTFEEYFAAGELVVRRKDRLGFIKTHLHDSRWREVIRLAVGIIGIIQHDEEEVTELVQVAVLNAGSRFEKWLHRDLVFAGLCLGDDVGVSVACRDEVVEAIVHLFLSSPYNSLRDMLSTMLASWEGTRAAIRAVEIVLPLLRPNARGTGVWTTYSGLSLYYQRLIQDYQEAQRKLRMLHILTILHHLQADSADRTDDMLKLLSDPDPMVRGAAADVLGQVGGEQPQVVDALLHALSDPTPSVRRAVTSALGQVKIEQDRVTGALLRALSDSDYTVRRATINALAQVNAGQTQVIEVLVRGLSDPHNAVREMAIDALAQVGGGQHQVVEALLNVFLSDSDTSMRKAAVSALAQVGVGQAQVLDALLDALSDPRAAVRDAAANALGQAGVGQARVLDALLNILSNSDSVSPFKGAAMNALGQLGVGQTQVVDVLLEAYPDSDLTIRGAIVRTVGQVGMGLTRVADFLLDVLSGPDISIRATAAKALGQLGVGQPRVIEGLLTALADSNSSIRGTAARALGQLGVRQPRVVDGLLDELSNSDSFIRGAAAAALVQLGAEYPKVIDVASKVLLSDVAPSVRAGAIGILGQLAVGQLQVVDAILEALSDPHADVRATAVKTLGQLGIRQPQVVDALLEVVRSDADAGVRETAASALGQLNTERPGQIDTLLAVLSDPHSAVRRAAAGSLAKVSAEETGVIDALLGLLSDSNQSVREAAVDSLISLGEKQPKVIGYLSDRLSDTFIRVIPQEAIEKYKDRLDAGLTIRALRLLGQLGVGEYRVIDILLEILSDTSSPFKEEAAIALGQVGKGRPQAIDAMLKALTDPNQTLPGIAAKALGQIGVGQRRVIAALLTALAAPHYNATVRGDIARALGQACLEQPQATDALRQAFSSSKVPVREAAVRALGQVGLGQFEVIEVLISGLSDPSSTVREAATKTLGHVGVGQPQVIDALLGIFSTSSNATLREEAAKALGQIGMGQSRVIDALLKVLSGSPVSVRRAALNSLGQTGVGELRVINALLKTLSTSKATLKAAAARALGQVGEGQSQIIDALLRALLDTDTAVRGAAVNALGQQAGGQSRVIDALLKVEADPDPTVRGAIVKALGQQAGDRPEVIDILLKALSDPNGTVRGTAIKTLGQVEIERPRVIEALLRTLAESDAAIKGAAAKALGQIGGGQPRVIDALLATLSDFSTAVREPTISALTTLRDDNEIIGQCIEELLQQYEPIAGSQFEADAAVDALLLALRQVVGVPTG